MVMCMVYTDALLSWLVWAPSGNMWVCEYIPCEVDGICEYLRVMIIGLSMFSSNENFWEYACVGWVAGEGVGDMI